jgi:hypothetical protein
MNHIQTHTIGMFSRKLALLSVAMLLALPTVVKAESGSLAGDIKQIQQDLEKDKATNTTAAEPTAPSANSARVKYPYPAAVVKQITSSCATAAKQLPKPIATQICSCAVTGLQNRYSMAELQKVSTTVSAKGGLPKPMEAIVSTCAQEAIQALKGN